LGTVLARAERLEAKREQQDLGDDRDQRARRRLRRRQQRGRRRAVGNGGGGGDDNAYAAGPGPQGGAALYSDFRTGKKLVLHQRGIFEVTPARLRDQLATMETALTAFDGAFLKLPATGAQITTTTAVKASAIAADLQPLYALKPARFKYNFASSRCSTTSTSSTTGPCRSPTSARSPGGARRRPGGHRHRQREPRRPARQLSLRHQVREPHDRGLPRPDAADRQEDHAGDPRRVPRRGGRRAARPLGHRPGVAASLVNREVDSAQLLGSFFAGFVEGRSSRALLVDGGTDYGLRTAEQFAASADWRKNGLVSAATDSLFINEGMRTVWPSWVTVSFGVRELDGARGNLLPNVPTLFANTLVQSLRAADNFVWASFDLDRPDQGGGGPTPTSSRRRRRAPRGDADRLALVERARQRHGAARPVLLDDRRVGAGADAVDPVIDNVWSGTGPLNTILEGPERQLLGDLERLRRGAGQRHLHVLRHHRRRHADHHRRRAGGRRVLLPGADRARRHHRPRRGPALSDQDPLFPGRRRRPRRTSAWQTPGGVKEPLPTDRMYPTDPTLGRDQAL
jgi:hypothetical protein